MQSFTLIYKIEGLTEKGYYIPLIDGGRIIECETIEEAREEMARVRAFYTRNESNRFTEISVERTRAIDERMANSSLINGIFKTARNLGRKRWN
jgi:hypothetical protein